MNKDYLFDTSFLSTIDTLKNREELIKITSLDWYEKPIGEIQGNVISSNFSLSGTSSIRRTCTLNIIADSEIYSTTKVKSLISINKKVKIEIGVINSTDKYVDEPILWFPQGIFVVITPSISKNNTGINISLQLKDKMSLLNGECGGLLPASTTFHEIEQVNSNGDVLITTPTIYQIIKEVVNHFGNEPLNKIIIDGVPLKIKKVMKWIGATPLYVQRNIVDNETQLTPSLNEDDFENPEIYYSGLNVGYTYSDFTYPGELIGNAGDSVCTILDKIKSILGNYEYFYDIEGNFVFQEIKNYLNTSEATYELENMKNEDYLLDTTRSTSAYNFTNSNIIQSYSNAPKFNMIKNDFIVWGLKESEETGLKNYIRYHLYIDNKVEVGNTYQVYFYKDSELDIEKAKSAYEVSTFSDLPLEGRVGEIYYIQETAKVYEWDSNSLSYNNIEIELESITTTDWRTELYLSGVAAEPLATDSNRYYVELCNEWTKIYDIRKGEFFEKYIKDPNKLPYYLDCIDTDASLSELSVSNIGPRTKVISDNDINCLFTPKIPDIILLNTDDIDLETQREECQLSGQTYMQVSSVIYKYLAAGNNFNSAFDKVKDLLYQYTSYNESISITSLPIYYLEPNTRITAKDIEADIYGDYIINSISYSIGSNGTMTINATRALEKI